MFIIRRAALSPEKDCISKKIHQEINTICKNNKHQMKPREYRAIANLVLSCAPVNFLIFGVGRDTALWRLSNFNGATVFLENSQEWINYSLQVDPTTTIYKINYTTKRTEWKDLLDNKFRLQLDLPPEISTKKWDIILVDSPGGVFDSDPGRMQSIYSSSIIRPRHFFLHDCNRHIEKIYFRKYFSKYPKKIRKLWYTSTQD